MSDDPTRRIAPDELARLLPTPRADDEGPTLFYRRGEGPRECRAELEASRARTRAWSEQERRELAAAEPGPVRKSGRRRRGTFLRLASLALLALLALVFAARDWTSREASPVVQVDPSRLEAKEVAEAGPRAPRAQQAEPPVPGRLEPTRELPAAREQASVCEPGAPCFAALSARARNAAEHLLSGRRHEALDVYRELTKARPDEEVFRLIVAALERELACGEDMGTPCPR